VVDQYADLGFDERMYYELVNCYTKLEKPEEAKYYMDMLVVTFPDSPYVKKAQSLK
jgi:outer membrane protein assembly factor BamD (BamD/ComL family)